MNTCFNYNLIKSLDTNINSAAYRWALLDDQENEKNPILIYVYKSGTATYTGGRNLLISKIYLEVKKHQYSLNQNSNGGPKLPLDKLVMVRYASGGASNIPDDETFLKEYDCNVDEDGDVIEQTVETQAELTEEERLRRRDKQFKAQTEYTKTRKATGSDEKKTIVGKRATELARQISAYEKQGYMLDGEALSVTLEVYSKILNELKDKHFREDYDTQNENSGDKYDILKYLIKIIFEPGNHAGGKSWVEGLILSILSYYDITPWNKIAPKTGLTKFSPEGEEIDDTEVSSALSKDKFNPMHAIELEDSYKEIFCNLALINVVCNGTLWQYIRTLTLKGITTKNHFSGLYGTDVDTYEEISQYSDKFNGKDCPNSRTNQTFLYQIANDKSWIKTIIDRAVSYLVSPLSEADIIAIQPHFLERADMIRACNSAQEFLEMIVFSTDLVPTNCLSMTREALICKKLNLVKNYNYLSLKDITRLSIAKACDLPGLLNKTLDKINSSKLTESRHLETIDKHEQAIGKLTHMLLTNIDYGTPLDLTKRVYNLADLTFPLYKLTVQKDTKAHARKHTYDMHIVANGIRILDENKSTPDDYKFMTLAQLNTFHMAKAEPVGVVMSDDRRQQIINQIESFKETIKSANLDIAKLTGNYHTYYSRNIARDNEGTLEAEAFILNTWVDPLVAKFELWRAEMNAKASTNPNIADTLKRVDFNLDHNLGKCTEDLKYTFASDSRNILVETDHSSKWLLKNVAEQKHLDQKLMLYEVTNNGDKIVSGGIPVQARVRKEGLYVISLGYVHAVVPMWYGCLEQGNSDIMGRFYTKLPCYAHNLLTTFLDIFTKYKELKDSPERLEAFSQATGIFFLSQEEAYVHAEELMSSYEGKLIIKDYYNREDKTVFRFAYYDVYQKLATLAGLVLDDPNVVRKRRFEGSTAKKSK